MAVEWHIARNGVARGPLTTQQFHQAIDAGEVEPADYVWRSDGTDWVSAAPYVSASQSLRIPIGVMAGFLGALLLAVIAGFVTLPTTQLGHLLEMAQAPNPEDAIRERLLRDEPDTAFFRSLAEKDAIAFDGLVSYVAAQNLSNVDEALPATRSYIIGQILQPKLSHLTDEEMTELMTITRDTSAQLAESSPSGCIASTLGQPAGDMRQLLDEGVRQREAAFLIRILDAPPRELDMPTAQQVQQINATIAQKLIAKHGERISLLDFANVKPEDQKDACLLFVEYHDEILHLPDADRAVMLKAMYINPALLVGDEASSASQTPPSAAPEAPAAAPPSVSQDAAPASPETAPSADDSAVPEFPASMGGDPDVAPGAQ